MSAAAPKASLRLMSWNVNGIRALGRKGFLGWLAEARPDVLGLQEIKARPEQLDPELLAPPGYVAHWHPAERAGYSGVAILSRERPSEVVEGLGIPRFDAEGRTLLARFKDFDFVTAYFPNGKHDLSRVPFKLDYSEAFLDYVNRLAAAGRKVVFCGDVNTAHRDIDLARPKENRKVTGFLPEECAWVDRLTEAGWIDAFRRRHPDRSGAYTWWSFRSGARERNVGWRIDYFFVGPGLWPQVACAAIHPEVTGSDHCPISLDLAPPAAPRGADDQP